MRITIITVATILLQLVFCKQTNCQTTISKEEILNDIKEFHYSKSSPNYKDILVDRFKTDEASLTDYHYYLLYYMQAKKPVTIYRDLFMEGERYELLKYAQKGKFKKVVKIGEKLIGENPLDLTTLVYLSMALDMITKQKNNKYYYRMQKIIEGIFSTGDGLSKETAFKIVNINDDDLILGFTGFDGTKRTTDGMYSIWENSRNEKLYFETVFLLE